jgi:transcriptional regulator with XRE-family HTH domain
MAIAYAKRAVEAAEMAMLSSDSSGNRRTTHSGPRESDTNGLGELLRRAREGRGLTLEQISNETKIPHRHLEALEHDKVAAVPGEFYRRAEIRAYARAVRLDQNIVLAELERASSPPVARAAVVERPRTQEPTLFRRRVLIAIVVVVAAALFGRSTGERKPAPDSRSQMRQRAQLDQVALPSPPSDTSTTVASEPSGVLASTASTSELSVTTDQGEPRISADSVTELVVTTQPAGARVTVNGIGWGIAPVTIRYLPAGPKRIRVTKDGHATEERMVRLAEGRPLMVDIQLRSSR